MAQDGARLVQAGLVRGTVVALACRSLVAFACRSPGACPASLLVLHFLRLGQLHALVLERTERICDCLCSPWLKSIGLGLPKFGKVEITEHARNKAAIRCFGDRGRDPSVFVFAGSEAWHYRDRM